MKYIVYLIIISEKFQANNYKRLEENFKRSIIRYFDIPNHEARLYVLKRFVDTTKRAREILFKRGVIPIGLKMHQLRKPEKEYEFKDYFYTLMFLRSKCKLENYEIDFNTTKINIDYILNK